jgi:hypothetical protein
MSSVELRATEMVDAEPVESIDERERLLLDVVVSLTKALRDERDRLRRRLAEVEEELEALPFRLGARPGAPMRRGLRAVAPIDPSRKPS